MTKQRGGQPGNQNALKHGFYSKRFQAVELSDLDILSDGTRENLFPRGKAFLNLLRARKKLRFQVLQQPGCYFGVHYDLGDRVGGRYEGEGIVLRISSVSFTLGGMGTTSSLPGPEPVEGQERIEIRCHQLS